MMEDVLVALKEKSGFRICQGKRLARRKTECGDVRGARGEAEGGCAGIQGKAGEIGPGNWNGKGTCSWLGFNDGCFDYSTHLQQKYVGTNKVQESITLV